MFDLPEKSLESFLYENKDVLVKALKLPKGRYYNIFRQVDLLDYGIADLVLVDDMLRTYLIELKTRPLKTEDIEQVCRYKKALVTYGPYQFQFKSCYLLGEKPEIGGQGDYIYVAQNTNGIRYFEYKKSLKTGLTFDEVIPGDWSLTLKTSKYEIREKIKKSLIKSIKKEEIPIPEGLINNQPQIDYAGEQ